MDCLGEKMLPAQRDHAAPNEKHNQDCLEKQLA
jgi:hypothetical protein